MSKKIISNIHIACNATANINAGVAGVTHSLKNEFEKIGIDAKDHYLSERGGWRKRVQSVLRPFELAKLAHETNPNVLDVSGGDIWVAAAQKNKNTLYVARSHGLEHSVNDIFLESVRQGKATKSKIHSFVFR